MSFQIDEIRLRQVAMPLVKFFETSFGRTYSRDMVLVEVVSNGVSGWGEVTAGENPFYNEEWTESAWQIVKHYVGPQLLNKPIEKAEDVAAYAKHVRGHRMARGGVEVAVWDLDAKLQGIPLWQRIGGGARPEIPSGVSLGIQDSVDDLLKVIEKELADGYQRIKMKIKPGRDVDDIREVRRHFPGIKLMADANSAYTLADVDRLRALDEFYLMMIEQPLAHDDIIDHAVLQAQLQTPICLDECIRSAHHAEQAIRLQAGQIINIKLGRVGGFLEAKKVHDIGRAHNVALATLPNFTLPGDVSGSKRYWKRELLTEEIVATPNGTIKTNDRPGFGYDIDMPFLDSITVRQETIR
jgi:O-succinylbenzoate synthase